MKLVTRHETQLQPMNGIRQIDSQGTNNCWIPINVNDIIFHGGFLVKTKYGEQKDVLTYFPLMIMICLMGFITYSMYGIAAT